MFANHATARFKVKRLWHLPKSWHKFENKERPNKHQTYGYFVFDALKRNYSSGRVGAEMISREEGEATLIKRLREEGVKEGREEDPSNF